jgi:OOP family OmpA-OmpF porin
MDRSFGSAFYAGIANDRSLIAAVMVFLRGARFARCIAMRAPLLEATLNIAFPINPFHLQQEFHMSSRLSLIAVIAGLSVAQAHAADNPSGYLIHGQDGSPVSVGYGGCVRTSAWTPDSSYRQCDPRPVAMELPAPVEAATVQTAPDSAPAPVIAGTAAVEPSRSVLLRISMATLFDFDSAILRGDAGPALDDLAKQLTQANYQKIDIVGHADRIGRAKYNQQLSEKRARAVREYLAAHGVDGSKITVSGAGSSEPLTAGKCEGLRGMRLVSCLQPDRSAEVTVTGTQASAMR